MARSPKRGAGTTAPAQPTIIGREAFAKISEVEGIRLSDEDRAMFAEFDRKGLSAEERRQAIVEKFKKKRMGQ
jgi:hypothetical protein